MKRLITILKSTQLPLRILFFAAMVMALPLFCSAQNDGISGEEYKENLNFRLGVKAGIGFSNLESIGLTNKQTRKGMAVGLYANYLIKEKFLIAIEFNGNLKGANFSFDSASSLNKLSLFYMDIPIILHYVYSKKAKILPFLGFQPSILFRKDVYKTQEALPQITPVGIKNYDFALTGGIFYRINQKIGLQLQFNYGIIDLNKEDPDQLILPFYPYLGKGEPMYNRNLQFCLVF